MAVKWIMITAGIITVVGIAIVITQNNAPMVNAFVRESLDTFTTTPSATTMQENTKIMDIKESVPSTITANLIADSYNMDAGMKKILTVQVAPAERATLLGSASVTGDGAIWIYVEEDGKEQCPASVWCGQDVVWGDRNFRYGSAGNEDNRPDNVRVNLVPGTEQSLVFENRGETKQAITFDLVVQYAETVVQ